MVDTDYGKMAYVKVLELESKLKSVENYYDGLKYNELNFKLNDADTKSYFEKTFKVNVFSEGNYKISGSVWTNSLTGMGVLIYVYVNDVLAHSFRNYGSSITDYDFEAVLDKGVNVIKTTLQAEDNYNLKKLNYKLCGQLDYVKTDNSLSLITFDKSDYILHLSDEKGYLYKYQTQSGLVFLYNFIGLYCANIIGVDLENIYIVSVNKEKTLSIVKFNHVKKEVVNIVTLNVGGVLSACGYMINNNFKIYFTRLNEVFTGSFSFGSEFKYSAMGRKGLKVYLEPNEKGYLIITDKFSLAKLVSI